MRRRLVAATLALVGCSAGLPPSAGPRGDLLAYATGAAVFVRAPDGSTARIARVGGTYGIFFSPDGRYLRWQSGEGLSTYDVTTGRTVTSPMRDEDSLVAVRQDDLLVADRSEASALGGPETVYAVRGDGTRTRLFTDGDGEPEGEVRNLPMGPAALTADGRRLVYEAGAVGDECELLLSIVARDLVADREQPLPVPPLPGDPLSRTASVATGLDGRTYAGITTAIGGCAQAEQVAVFRLDGDRWTQVRTDAVWASADRAGHLAVLRPTGELLVGTEQVADGVEYAAWGRGRP